MATFYLKYRPQTIEELDLDSVRLQLTKTLESKSLPHAFLFSGPRGLGKTSAARILAKAINCERTTSEHSENSDNQKARRPENQRISKSESNSSELSDTSGSSDILTNRSSESSEFSEDSKSIEPCNQCEACISITKGNAIDVIEIDGASNRGIDDVRTLREGVASAPLHLAKKVYVIDEVHMLTKEAFNALLKTLEEPPEHVVFILATTEPGKVPDTIISRAFHIQFHKANEAELTRSLSRVIEGEGLSVTPGALQKIILRSQGGFRDSAKMLEQLAMNSKTIDETVFASIFTDVNTTGLLHLFAGRQCREAFEWVHKANQQGVDWEDAFRILLEKLRLELLAHFGIGVKEVDNLSLSEIQTLISLFTQASQQLKTALIPSLPLELVIAGWCGGGKVESIEQEAASREQRVKSSEQRAESAQNTLEIEKLEVRSGPTSHLKVIDSSLSEPSENSNHSAPKLPLPELEQLKSKWEEVLKAVRLANHSVEGLLRSACLESVEKETVNIKVYYSFHKGQLERESNLKIVEQAFTQVFGIKLRIRYVIGQKEEKTKLETQKDNDFAKMAEEILIN